MSIADEIIAREPRRFGAAAFEAALAIATLTGWRLLEPRRQGSQEQRARAMVFLPLVGLAFGVMLALVDRALAGGLHPLSRSALVIVVAVVATKGLHLLGVAHVIGDLTEGRGAGRRARHHCAGASPAPPFSSWTGLTEVWSAGALAAFVFLALEIYLLGAIAHPPARARAIVLVVMLSRWAIVPVAIGLKPIGRFGLGVAYEGGIKFREFALSSVIALALAMGLYEAYAIAAIVAVAIAILLMRLLLSRRLGGVDGFALAASGALTELAALATLAAIGV